MGWKTTTGMVSVPTGIVGAAALPTIGFGLKGIAAGSAAAAWQSSIGCVAAGSVFAGLQSLGASGYGMLLFGGVGAAIPGLGVLAVLAASKLMGSRK